MQQKIAIGTLCGCAFITPEHQFPFSIFTVTVSGRLAGSFGPRYPTPCRHIFAMGKKAAKSTRKFAASGQLKKTIQNRKKHQQIQKKAAGRRGANRDAKGKGKIRQDDDGDVEDEMPVSVKKGMKR